MRSETGALRCWGVLTLVVGCLGAAAVFTLPAYAHEIIAWGEQAFDSSDFPITNAVAIAAGQEYSLALKSDPSGAGGSIVGWGRDNYGQAAPPDGNEFVAVAAGGSHSLALKSVCDFVLAGDMNDDCKVTISDLNVFADDWLSPLDFNDFAPMAENWLIDCIANPSEPACVPK